jgi:hypothetical protein
LPSCCASICAFFRSSWGLAAPSLMFSFMDTWLLKAVLERKPAPLGRLWSSSLGIVLCRAWPAGQWGFSSLASFWAGAEMFCGADSVLVCKHVPQQTISGPLWQPGGLKLVLGKEERLVRNPSPWLEDGGGCLSSLGL